MAHQSWKPRHGYGTPFLSARRMPDGPSLSQYTRLLVQRMKTIDWLYNARTNTWFPLAMRNARDVCEMPLFSNDSR
jgi:hypothetical protein